MILSFKYSRIGTAGQGRRQKIFQGSNGKKDQKIALISLFRRRGQRKKDQKWQKRTENSTIKHLCTICTMYKNLGGPKPLPMPLVIF